MQYSLKKVMIMILIFILTIDVLPFFDVVLIAGEELNNTSNLVLQTQTKETEKNKGIDYIKQVVNLFGNLFSNTLIDSIATISNDDFLTDSSAEIDNSVNTTTESYVNTTTESHINTTIESNVNTTIDIFVDFIPGSISVVIKKLYSEINKEWYITDFPEANIESIKDLTWIDGDVSDKKYLNYDNFQQILEFILVDKTSEGVVEAITQLQSNPYIEHATPNHRVYADEPDDTTSIDTTMGLMTTDNIINTTIEINTTGESGNTTVSGVNTTTDIFVDFIPGSISVVIKKPYSEINKEWYITDFPEANIESIKDLTWIDGDVSDKKYLNYDNFQQILEFILVDKTSEGVVEAVIQLQSNPYIEYATPNHRVYADEPDDTTINISNDMMHKITEKYIVYYEYINDDIDINVAQSKVTEVNDGNDYLGTPPLYIPDDIGYYNEKDVYYDGNGTRLNERDRFYLANIMVDGILLGIDYSKISNFTAIENISSDHEILYLYEYDSIVCADSYLAVTTDPILPSNTSITGRYDANADITITFPSGRTATTRAEMHALWSIAVPNDEILKPGDVINLTATIYGLCGYVADGTSIVYDPNYTVNTTIDLMTTNNIVNTTNTTENITNTTIGVNTTNTTQSTINTTAGTNTSQGMVNTTVGTNTTQDTVNTTVGSNATQNTTNTTIGVDIQGTTNITVGSNITQGTVNTTVGSNTTQSTINITVGTNTTQSTINTTVGSTTTQNTTNTTVGTNTTQNTSNTTIGINITEVNTTQNTVNTTVGTNTTQNTSNTTIGINITEVNTTQNTVNTTVGTNTTQNTTIGINITEVNTTQNTVNTTVGANTTQNTSNTTIGINTTEVNTTQNTVNTTVGPNTTQNTTSETIQNTTNVNTGIAPILLVKEQDIVNQGSTINLKPLIIEAKDSKGNDLKDDVLINGEVNTSKVGAYTISFSVTDENGMTSTAKSIVSVRGEETVIIGDNAIEAHDFSLGASEAGSITERQILTKAGVNTWNIPNGEDLSNVVKIDKTQLKDSVGQYKIAINIDLLKATIGKNSNGEDAAIVIATVYEDRANPNNKDELPKTGEDNWLLRNLPRLENFCFYFTP